MDTFEEVFRSAEPVRDKYLSRLFGLFSESVVHIWCTQPDAAYEDLGRPTLRESGTKYGHTLDFTLSERSTGRIYIAEAKCELEYNNYQYLSLEEPVQIAHHTSTAFAKFLRVAADPTAYDVRLKGAPVAVDGAILVWGAVTPAGRAAAMSTCGFADVLSIESMVTDLKQWSPPEWADFIGRYRRWTTELFDYLGGS
jgi:hypothetical protein